MMSLSLLLLLMLFTCSCQAADYFGTVMSFYPKQPTNNGSITVVLRYKLNFRTCTQSDTWECVFGNCGTQSSVELHKVYNESSGEWCQREGIMTLQLPVSESVLSLQLRGGNWTNNINGITEWLAGAGMYLLTRSDTGQANRPPQTTILPVVRVPSNCQRDFNLLAFDPDGDEVKCFNRAPLSVLNVSSSCSLSFSSTSSSNEGPYAVQLVMGDFPKQNIILNQTIPLTPNNALSYVPVQFVFKVDPVVPSCTEGLYLPKFLPPTPANRARLYTPVHQTLEISVNAEAKNSTISELLFSGPYNVNQTTSGAGQFILRWTPSEDQDGESYPICFVAQAVKNSDKYQSELRCVVVTVGNNSTANIQPTATQPTTTSINMTTTQTTAVPSTAPPTTTVNESTTQHMPTPSTTPSTTTLNTTTPHTTTQSTTTPRTTTQSTTTPRTTTPRTTTSSTTTPEDSTIITTPDDTTLSSTPVIDVFNQIVVGLRVKISSSSPLSDEDIRTTVLQQLKDELVRRGLPSNISLSFRKRLTTTVPSAGPT